MFRALKHAINYGLARAGYQIRRIPASAAHSAPLIMPDEPDWIQSIIAKVQPYTMTSPHKLTALCRGVEYIVRCKIPGDIVECGVWKGGSIMAAALTLLRFGDTERTLRLFDTFEGMSSPTDDDWTSQFGGVSAAEILARSDRSEHVWAYSPIEEVRQNVLSVGYPSDRFEFVKGKVEDTVPQGAPSQIALLRLDTDWYESTRHELIHLYPRLAQRGVLLLDDYGSWEGARIAVDEYVRDNNLPLLLNRVEPSGRIAIKP